MIFKTPAIAAIVFAALFSGAAATAQDAEAGKKVFKKCTACHKVGEDAKNTAGPVLNELIGRPAGSVEGFKYGKGMIEASEMGLVWTAETIDSYITDPKAYLREFTGNKKAKAKMTFKLKKEEHRLDVIAYLATFSTAICVQNAAEEALFFAAEGGEDSRVTKELQPGETLCTAALGAPMEGTVSVFTSVDAMEGCSRIVASGMVEQMKTYAEADGCLWSSNDG